MEKFPDAQTLSDSTREKHRNKTISLQTRKKISEARKGKTLEEFYGESKATEIKEKISESMMGDKNPFFGKQHTDETKQKISMANMGNKNPMVGKTYEEFYGEKKANEIKEKLVTAKIGYYPSPESLFKKGMIPWNIGIPRRPETIEKIKETKRINNIPSAFKGKTHTDEANEKNRLAHLGKTMSEETKKKMSLSALGKTKSKEWKEKIAESHRENWKDADFRDRRISEIFEAFKIAPNKTEQKLDDIIQSCIPNEYQFCGNGDVVLGGKVPDWINCNGKKKLIEMFGTYWHGKKRTGKTRKEAENERKIHFKQYGFDTLIIWENKIPNTELIRDMIVGFTNR